MLTNEKQYKRITYNQQDEASIFRGIIGRLNSNGLLKIQYEETYLKKEEAPEDECIPNEKEFYIRDCILNESAYAACDGSIKNHLFAG